MRELHVVSLSEDGRSVLLATSKKATAGGYKLKLDDKIRAALKGDLPRPGETAVRSTGVSPKDIQARMRAGESAEEIAASAGVPVARIERFAGPVLSERERIIDEARAAFLSRGRLGPSLLPLGDAVDAALAETASLRPETVAWTARRLDSGHWLVQVSYVARARTRTGSWVYDPATRSIVPSDPASAALGHTGEQAPVRKTATAGPRAVAAPRSSGVKRKGAARPGSRASGAGGSRRPAPTSPRPTAAREAAAKAERAAAAKAAREAAAKAERAAAAKAAREAAAKAERAAAAKAARAERAAAAKAAREAAAKAEQAAAARAAKAAAAKAERAAAAKAAREAAAKAERAAAAKAAREEAKQREALRRTSQPAAAEDEPDSPPTLRVVPAPPAELVPTPAPKRRAAGERATVPDWADVLFGTAPRADRNDG